MRIFMNVAENSGVGYYRQYLPAQTIRDLGLAEVKISDFRWAEGEHAQLTPETIFKVANWADIIIIGRQDRTEYYAQWGAVKEKFNVPIVLDTDDNIFHVRPSNPGYQGYHPGSEAITWNKYAVSKIVSAMTVSTENLVEVYKKYLPHVFHLPNNLDMKWWDSCQKAEHDDLKIGFICSGAHSEGFQIIAKPLAEILRKYPVKFYYPEMYWRVMAGMPDDVKDKLVQVKWSPLKEWAKNLNAIGLDIGLAPLSDNFFNRAKSNLRWMEYSASHIASIVSPVKAYACVKHLETGLVAKEREDWFEMMKMLIESKQLRDDLSNRAYQEVSQNYDIWKNAGRWVKTYAIILDKYQQFYGQKKKYISAGKNKWAEITHETPYLLNRYEEEVKI